MSDSNSCLPAVFYQRSEENNERLGSLLSSVLMRKIRPDYTQAIEKAPLSLWTSTRLREEDCRKGFRSIPVVLCLEKRFPDVHMRRIAREVKFALTESGFLVVEWHAQELSQAFQAHEQEDDDVFGSFHPDSAIFVVDFASGSKVWRQDTMGGLCSRPNVVGIISMDPSDTVALGLLSAPQLLLLSSNAKDSTATITNSLSSHIGHHRANPNATVLALPYALTSYDDNHARSLWIIRTVLKWMKAIQLVHVTGPHFSRL